MVLPLTLNEQPQTADGFVHGERINRNAQERYTSPPTKTRAVTRSGD